MTKLAVMTKILIFHEIWRNLRNSGFVAKNF